MTQLARWWMVLLGGALLGAGLCLYGQLAVAHHLRDEVRNTFFLWRGIGQLTFIFQGDLTKTALWMNEVPEPVLRESGRASWTLVILGGVAAIAGPMLQPWRRVKRAKGSR